MLVHKLKKIGKGFGQACRRRLAGNLIVSAGVALALYAIGCSKAQMPIGPQKSTTLDVTAITPDGASVDSAKVFLNGQLAGYTPYKNETIVPGVLALRVMKDGYQIYTEQIVIEEDRKYNIEAVLSPIPVNEGELLITVNEDSALVRVKDSQENVVVETDKRVSSHTLPSGAYVVSAEKTGYTTVVKAVEVVSGKATTVNLELTRPGTTPQAPTLQFQILEDTVQVGVAFTLAWESNGRQVIIDQGIGARGPSGSEKVISISTGLKIFTATAYGENNLVTTKTDSVFIAPKPVNAPTLNFSVLADSIVYGEPAVIQWESDGNRVVIDQGVGARGPVGSEEVYFQSPGKKVFTATAYSDDNVRTIRRDSVYVKEAPTPLLPVVMISTTRRVTVNTPATISWVSQNADYLVVDYVSNPQSEGSQEITFTTPGIRIVTATAFNRAGYVSASDTINVVEPDVVAVEDILILGESGVRADKGEAGMEMKNAAVFEVQTAGRYRLLAEVWYNSGDEQRNESFYLQIRDAANTIKLPQNPNAGVNRVVEDEAGDPHTSTRGCGFFQLGTGSHAIDLYHYAKISALYPEFLNGPIDGPESVKILGYKLVYLGN